jgi:Protein of unknown function (DUF1838)
VPDRQNLDPWSRRSAMAAMLAGAGLAARPADASSANKRQWTSSFLDLDPLTRFRHAMRVQRSLQDEADILHWYHFIMFAVPVGAVPRPVVRWEGIELSRHQCVGDNKYRLHGHNLSFPRDLNSGAFVDLVLNPVTQKIVSVPPMALTQDPGMIRSPEGIVSLDKPSAKPRPNYIVLRREGAFVKVDAVRVPPDSWPVTFIEGGYESTPAALFDDPRQLWLPADVSGAYVFPWPTWMQMGDQPGHMFATWSGYKLRSIEQLPDDFRRRAERDYPQLLSVDRKLFSKPIPGLVL